MHASLLCQHMMILCADCLSMGLQAPPAKDDVHVPAPFPDGAASEDALGARIVNATSSGAHYQSIEQVGLQPTCCTASGGQEPPKGHNQRALSCRMETLAQGLAAGHCKAGPWCPQAASGKPQRR